MKFDSPAKKGAAVLLSVLAIGAAAFFIYKYTNRPPEELLRHHNELGRVLAKEVIRLMEDREKDKKRLVIITAKAPDTALAAQMAAFHEELKKDPQIELKEVEELEPSGSRRVGPGQGLSARKFVRIVENNLKADVMVSFVGLPDPGDDEMKSFTAKVPRFVAETTDPGRAEDMFDKKMLRMAVAPRYEFPSPVKDPKTDKEWFDKFFQVIKPPKSTNSSAAATTAEPPKDATP